jgi:hypothetical protein
LAGEKDKICPLRSNAQERILLARADQLGSQDLVRKIKLVAPWLGKMISRCTQRRHRKFIKQDLNRAAPVLADKKHEI